MKLYALHDASGHLVYETQVHDDVTPMEHDGLLATEISESAGVPPFAGARFHVPTKKWVDPRTESERQAQAVADVRAARSSAYPSIGEQLDMLWHAMDRGDMPKVAPFYDAIKAVKDSHPKE